MTYCSLFRHNKANSGTFSVDGGGLEYTLIRSDRKTLSIEINRECKITVRAPKKLSQKRIDSFVNERAEWIEKSLSKQRERGASQKEYSADEIEGLRADAKTILPPKIEYYSALMGVTPTGFRVTSAKTRYGSCSGKNSINFSLYLMDKPEAAIDYVVVHELAHIRFHNHSKDFYRFIETIMPDYKKRESLLKK